MALSERTILTEVLIRFHDDGRIGAHAAYLNQVLRDGTVISSTPTGPHALSTEDFEGSESLSTLLRTETKTALVRNEHLQSQVSQLSEQFAQVLAQMATAKETYDEKIGLAQQRIDVLTKQLNEMNSFTSEL